MKGTFYVQLNEYGKRHIRITDTLEEFIDLLGTVDVQPMTYIEDMGLVSHLVSKDLTRFDLVN